MARMISLYFLTAATLLAPPIWAADSQCFGTVSHGGIQDSVKPPTSGSNFTVYSALAAAAGRTFVHSKVSAILDAAYAALA